MKKWTDYKKPVHNKLDSAFFYSQIYLYFGLCCEKKKEINKVTVGIFKSFWCITEYSGNLSQSAPSLQLSDFWLDDGVNRH